MGFITLDGQAIQTDTLISNRFLDEYMPAANGEFVKIYLYLLRSLSLTDSDLSVCHIADIFNQTEKDVMRALKYWQKLNLLDLRFTENKLTGITLKSLQETAADTSLPAQPGSQDTSPVSVQQNMQDASPVSVQQNMQDASPASIQPNNANNIAPVSTSNGQTVLPFGQPAMQISRRYEKHAYTPGELAMFRSREEVFEFLYLAEKYMGKPLSTSDTNTLIFIYDVLGFSPELIEYLLEYCISNGHKSMRYIEKVAISWAEENINTIELAKAHTDQFNKSCYPVLKAFGLNGRNPGTVEKAMIVKWTNTYGFQMDIILEACDRTIRSIHQPSFDYADSILSNWKNKGVKSLSDIRSLDENHQKEKNTAKSSPAPAKSSDKKKNNSFNQFDQRNYDYEALEKKLLKNT